MTSKSELMMAYSSTMFEADTLNGTIVLRAGEHNESLAELYRVTGTWSSAYVTAWNPASLPQTEEQNSAAHHDLLKTLNARGFGYYGGYGRDPDGYWPPEKSVLVMGIAEPDACEIGRQFGQAAIVIANADAVPQLRWLLVVPPDLPKLGGIP